MKVQFSENAWEDYLFRQKNDIQILKRINKLIRDIQRNHYQGVGKPEALRHNLAGWWSRRITSEHRIVYRIEKD